MVHRSISPWLELEDFQLAQPDQWPVKQSLSYPTLCRSNLHTWSTQRYTQTGTNEATNTHKTCRQCGSCSNCVDKISCNLQCRQGQGKLWSKNSKKQTAKPWPHQQPLLLLLTVKTRQMRRVKQLRSLIHFLRCGYTIPSRRHFSDIMLLDLFVVSCPTQAATRLNYFYFASRQLWRSVAVDCSKTCFLLGVPYFTTSWHYLSNVDWGDRKCYWRQQILARLFIPEILSLCSM